MVSILSCASWPCVCLLWSTVYLDLPFIFYRANKLPSCSSLFELGFLSLVTGWILINFICLCWTWGRTLFDINLSYIFFDPFPRIMKIKTKINKWDLIKLKSFCIAKETKNKTERQPTEWEKIFANEVTEKGLICKIYKHLL